MRYWIIVIAVLAAAVVLSPTSASSVLAASDSDTHAGGDQGAQTGARRANDTEGEIEESEEGKDSQEVPATKLVESKRERKTARIKNWISGLKGDKESIHREYGYPSGRYRQEVMGRVIEKWTYSEKGKTFIFEGSKIVDER